MTTAFELVEEQALRLSNSERAQLAEHLLVSLGSNADDEIDSAWAKEVEKRMALLESGQVVGVPFEQAMEQIYAALK